MKQLKIWGNILFVASIITPILGFMVSCTVGDVDTFDMAGMLHYIWIMWLFIPISIASLIIGFCLKKGNEKYKKNIVVASIVIPVLILFGSYGFIFSSTVSYDADVLKDIEQQTEWAFPNNAEIGTLIEKDYCLSFVKIADDADNIAFEEKIKTSDKWTNSLPNAIIGILPFEARIKTQNCKYFMFYNKATKQYNVPPTLSGAYDCVYMAYDEGRVIVLFNCMLQFTA